MLDTKFTIQPLGITVGRGRGAGQHFVGRNLALYLQRRGSFGKRRYELPWAICNADSPSALPAMPYSGLNGEQVRAMPLRRF